MPLKFLLRKGEALIIENMKFPDYSLSDSLEFVKPLVYTNFSSINKDQFAKLRGFNPYGGAFNLRLSSARLWGLISDGNPFNATLLSKSIFNSTDNADKFKKIFITSKSFDLFNKLSRDLNLLPSNSDISRVLHYALDQKTLRKIKNIITDIRIHANNFSPNEENYIQTKDLKLQLKGVKIDVEESRESLLAAIKLLESRLDLFRI